MDLAEFANIPRPFLLGNVSCFARHLTLNEWGLIARFIKLRHPRPPKVAYESIHANSPEERMALFEAKSRDHRNWPYRPCSPAWFDALAATNGHGYFLWVALRCQHPSLTRAGADSLAGDLSASIVGTLALYTMGLYDPDDPPLPGPEVDRSKLEASDNVGRTVATLMKAGLSPRQIGHMTYPHVWNYLRDGRPRQAPGQRSFNSLRAALEWRRSQANGSGIA